MGGVIIFEYYDFVSSFRECASVAGMPELRLIAYVSSAT
jgi:hypothetical protein